MALDAQVPDYTLFASAGPAAHPRGAGQSLFLFHYPPCAPLAGGVAGDASTTCCRRRGRCAFVVGKVDRDLPHCRAARSRRATLRRRVSGQVNEVVTERLHR